MDLHFVPVELVELLKHADVEGKKLTWNLQVNVIAVTVNLIWIKAENPIATNCEVTSQAPKKKPDCVPMCIFSRASVIALHFDTS
jgi:hypothetical protein